MSSMYMYNFSKEDIIKTTNQAKEVTVNFLVNDGVITKEQGESILSKYAITIVDDQPTFGDKIRKVFGYDKDEKPGRMTFTMVKFVGVL